ncbi:unnamed protein product [Acanthoscelides obtectus]|uniref:Protein CUSTOS n=1 Tax=Acanthoscelides obtectus TaxID=200917 RepID=A0A9P0JSV3_ACAOB|nr:unnamed protein product [Acanthoscelides obtectus]CAK1663663.1 hypothetical protein AOBTE_LOCUS23783 [Acanthoscelides obtectus]
MKNIKLKMSSDSSDDDNIELLKEAQDSQFINDSMFNKGIKGKKVAEKIELPGSLRKCKDEDEQFNLLKVTPQFQQYVSKQLDTILDSSLKYKKLKVSTATVDCKRSTKEYSGGVKLFHTSETVLDDSSVDFEDISSKSFSIEYKKLKVDVDEESFKEVVVTGEDILSRESTKHWSKRGKAPMFEYKKQKNGQITLIEPTLK